MHGRAGQRHIVRRTAWRAAAAAAALWAGATPPPAAAAIAEPRDRTIQADRAHRARMEEALRALRTRDKGSFVVFEDRLSKKFVQFAGSRWERLLLDLPTQPLDPDEMRRASAFFAKRGVQLHTWTVEGPDGERREQSSFQLELGADVERAAKLALGVFREVYHLPPDFSLEITGG
jgi:hypothetical protein